MEDVPDLQLRDFINAVSEELIASQSQRIAAGKPALFEVSEVLLEVNFVVSRSKSGGGGFSYLVLKADANVKYESQNVQKVTLKLKPLNLALPEGGFGPIRPQLADDTRP